MSGASESQGCPHDDLCLRCPCAGDDDVCFPGERLKAERNEARAELARLREAIVQHKSSVLFGGGPTCPEADEKLWKELGP